MTRICAELGGRLLRAVEIIERQQTCIVTFAGLTGLGFRSAHLTIPRPKGNTHLTFEAEDGSKIAIYGDGVRITSETPSEAIAHASRLQALPDFWSNALRPIGSDPDHCVQLWSMGLPHESWGAEETKTLRDDVVVPEPAELAERPDVPLNISVFDCPVTEMVEATIATGFIEHRAVHTELSATRRLVVVVGWPRP